MAKKTGYQDQRNPNWSHQTPSEHAMELIGSTSHTEEIQRDWIAFAEQEAQRRRTDEEKDAERAREAAADKADKEKFQRDQDHIAREQQQKLNQQREQERQEQEKRNERLRRKEEKEGPIVKVPLPKNPTGQDATTDNPIIDSIRLKKTVDDQKKIYVDDPPREPIPGLKTEPRVNQPVIHQPPQGIMLPEVTIPSTSTPPDIKFNPNDKGWYNLEPPKGQGFNVENLWNGVIRPPSGPQGEEPQGIVLPEVNINQNSGRNELRKQREVITDYDKSVKKMAEHYEANAEKIQKAKDIIAGEMVKKELADQAVIKRAMEVAQEEVLKGLTDSQKTNIANIGRIEAKNSIDPVAKVTYATDLYKELNFIEEKAVHVNVQKMMDKKLDEEKGFLNTINNWMVAKSHYLHTSGDTYGLTNEEAKRYAELKIKRRELETPVARELLKRHVDYEENKLSTNERKHTVTYNTGVVDFNGNPLIFTAKVPVKDYPNYKDAAALDIPTLIKYQEKEEDDQKIKDRLERNKKKLTDFIDNRDGVLDGLDFEGNWRDYVFIGIPSMKNDVETAYALYRHNNGKELSDYQRKILEVEGLTNEMSDIDMSSGRTFYRWGEGFSATIPFVTSTIATYGSGAAVSKLASAGIKVAVSAQRQAIKGILDQSLRNGVYFNAQVTLGTLKTLDKMAQISGYLIPQAIISPNTYARGSQKYTENIRTVNVGGKELLLANITDRLRLQQQSKNSLNRLENEVSKLKMNDPEYDNKLAKYNSAIYYIHENLSKVYDPFGKTKEQLLTDVGEFNCLLYGFFDSIKELASEKYVGEVGDLGIKWLKGALGKESKDLLAAIAKYEKTAGKGVNELGITTPKGFLGMEGKEAVEEGAEAAMRNNDVTGELGKSVLDPLKREKIPGIGSTSLKILKNGLISKNALSYLGLRQYSNHITSEIFEEMTVSLTPGYGELDRWGHQIEELATATYYIDVAANTLMLKGSMKGISIGKDLIHNATSSDFREQLAEREKVKKAQKKLYDDIDNGIADDKEAKRIVMSVGASHYNVAEYVNEINALRREGKGEAADMLSNSLFFDTATKALEIGTLKEYRKSLENAIVNQAMDEELMGNAIKALSELKNIEEINEKYESHENGHKLIGAEITKLQINRTNEGISKELNKVQNIEMIDRFVKALGRSNKKFEGAIFNHSDMSLNDPELLKALGNLSTGKLNDLISLHYLRQANRAQLETADEVINVEGSKKKLEEIKAIKIAKAESEIRNLTTVDELEAIKIQNMGSTEVIERANEKIKLLKDIEARTNADDAATIMAEKEKVQPLSKDPTIESTDFMASLDKKDDKPPVDVTPRTYLTPLEPRSTTVSDKELVAMYQKKALTPEQDTALVDITEEPVNPKPVITTDEKKEDKIFYGFDADGQEWMTVNGVKSYIDKGELSFARTGAKKYNVGPSAKARLAVLVASLKAALNPPGTKTADEKAVSIYDVIGDLVAKHGDQAEEKFDQIVATWESVYGVIPENVSNSIFNDFFGKDKSFMDEMDELEEMKEDTTTDSNGPLKETDKKPNEEKPPLPPIPAEMVAGDRRINSEFVKMTVLGQLRQRVVNKFNNITYRMERFLREIKETDIVKNRFILDSRFMYNVQEEAKKNPDVLQARQAKDGEAEIYTMPSSEMQQEYDFTYINSNGEKQGFTLSKKHTTNLTWGQAKIIAESKLGKDTPAYQEWKAQFVPVLIIYNGKMSDGKDVPISTIRDHQYYNVNSENVYHNPNVAAMIEMLRNDGTLKTVHDINTDTDTYYYLEKEYTQDEFYALLNNDVNENGAFNIRATRRVIAKEGGSVRIKITERKPGQWHFLEKDMPLETVSSLDNDARLGVANLVVSDDGKQVETRVIMADDKMFEGKMETISQELLKAKSSELGSPFLQEPKAYSRTIPFMMIPAYVDKDGVQVYRAIFLINESPHSEKENLRKPLPKELRNTAKYATIAALLKKAYTEAKSANLTNENATNFDFYNALKKAIETKYNITSNELTTIEEGITKSHGIFLHRVVAKKKSTEMGIQTFLGSFLNAGGKGKFNSFLEPLIKSSTTLNNEYKTLDDANKAAAIKKFMDALGRFTDNILPVQDFYLSVATSAKVKKMRLINDTGKFEDAEMSYEDQMKRFFKTNVVTHNIEGIDEKKKVISDVEPHITLAPVDAKGNTIELEQEKKRQSLAATTSDNVNTNTQVTPTTKPIIPVATSVKTSEIQKATTETKTETPTKTETTAKAEPTKKADVPNDINTIEEEIQALKKAREQTQKTLDDVQQAERLKSTLQEEFNMSEDQARHTAKKLLLFKRKKDNDKSASRLVVTKEEEELISKINNNQLSKLSYDEQRDLVDTIKNEIGNKFAEAIKKGIPVTSEMVISFIKEVSTSVIDQQIKTNSELLALMSDPKMKLYTGFILGIQSSLDKLNNAKKEINKVKNDIREQFSEIFNVDLTQEEEDMLYAFDGTVPEHNFSKENFERNILSGFSGEMLLMLFGIPRLDADGDIAINSMGMTDFYSPQEAYRALLSVTCVARSNFNEIIGEIERRYGVKVNGGIGKNVYRILADRLTSMPVQLKDKFMYKMTTVPVVMLKALLRTKAQLFVDNKPLKTKNGNLVYGSTTSTIIDEDGKKAAIALRIKIENSFFEKYSIPGTNHLNIDFVKDMHEKVGRLMEMCASGNYTSMDKNNFMAETLRDIGFAPISNSTFREAIARTARKDTILYGEKKSSLLNILYDELSNLNLKYNENAAKGEPLIISNNDNNILKYIYTSRAAIVALEIELNDVGIGSSSMYVAGKSISNTMTPTGFHDRIAELLTNDKLVKELLASAYAGDNYILRFLNDPTYKRLLPQLPIPSLESIEIAGSKNTMNVEYDKLTEADHLKLLLNMYLSKNTAFEDGNTLDGLTFKIVYTPIVTTSDKGSTIFMPVPGIQLTAGDIIQYDGGRVGPDLDVLNFLANQIFDTELNRIIESYDVTRRSRFENYNEGSKLFYNLPSFNSIAIKQKGVMTNIHTILFDNKGKIEPTVREALKGEAIKKILSYIDAETKQKIRQGRKGLEGQFVDAGFYVADKPEHIQHLDTDRLAAMPIAVKNATGYDQEIASVNTFKTLENLAVEFITNNLLSQVGRQQILFSDLAFYSKMKLPLIKSPKLGLETVDVAKLTSLKFLKGLNDHIGAVLQKRSAGLRAPGNKFAESDNLQTHYAKNITYITINDVVSTSSHIKEVVAMYQKKELTTVQETALDEIIKLREIEKNPKTAEDVRKDVRDSINKIVSEHFVESAPYFNIKGTDSQQYVTWKFYLEMLERKGAINAEKRKLLAKKIESDELTDAQYDEILNINMNPGKPVYMQNIQEEGRQVPIHIKCSFFPLLPKLTKGLKIDKMRQLMEAVEKKHTTVDAEGVENYVPCMAGYKSSNKITSPKTLLTMEHIYAHDYSKDVGAIPYLKSATMTLPMSGLKTQQESPSKELNAYLKGKDPSTKISMGTQFFKTILGNFISHEKKEIFPAKIFDPKLLSKLKIKPNAKGEISGEDLNKIYEYSYSSYLDVLVEKLQLEIGLKQGVDFDDMTDKEKNTVIENLQAVISNEVSIRGYPAYVKDSIELMDDNGESKMVSPIMFDNKRYKFEQLLKSVIKSNIINHKLPGNTHVLASSEGFEKDTKLKAVAFEDMSEKDKSGIVWVNNTPGELRSTYVEDKDGKRRIVESEILIQSHFKYYNKDKKRYIYVDLTSDEYSHVDPATGSRILDLNKWDEDLLTMFSFRIPSSSHQSGVLVKVAGFLPEMSQDLLVAAKEYLVQVGEDYDFDKRYIYKSNYIVDKNNNIIKLRQEHMDEYMYNMVTPEVRKQMLYKKFSAIVNKMMPEGREEFFNTLNSLDDEIKSLTILVTAIVNDLETLHDTEPFSDLFRHIVGGNANAEFSDLIDDYYRKKAAADKAMETGDVSIYEQAALEQDAARLELDKAKEAYIRAKAAELNLPEEFGNKEDFFDAMLELAKGLENNSVLGYEDQLKLKEEQKKEYERIEKSINLLWVELMKKQGEVHEVFKKAKKDAELNYKKKLLENSLIDVYKSVYMSTDPDIQKNIIKSLSIEEAKLTANVIFDAADNASSENMSIFSDNYQRELLLSSADSGTGMGVYSNCVTFEALLQKLANHHKVSLHEVTRSNDGEPKLAKFSVNIGELHSDGILGNSSQTLDGKRNISDVHAENQNVSADQINEQIMGKRNENRFTIPAYAMMAHLGFDLTKDKVQTNYIMPDGNPYTGHLSVASLFISQPIIKDYIEILKHKRTISSTGSRKNIEQEVILELFNNLRIPYDKDEPPTKRNLLTLEQYTKASDDLTGQLLYTMLDRDAAYKNYVYEQLTVLQNYLGFVDDHARISMVQQLVDISGSSNLGISYFETLQAVDQLDKIAGEHILNLKDGMPSNNFTKLIGEVADAPLEGYTKIGGYYWKPTTNEGKLLVSALAMEQQIMPVFFPYEASTIQNAINDVLIAQEYDPTDNTNYMLKMKYEIMTEFISFINLGTGVFSGDIDNERERIFYDDPVTGHLSLGHILSELGNNPNGIIQNNTFLRNLDVTLDDETRLYVIKKLNSKDLDLGKREGIQGFTSLLQDNTTVIGVFNGVEYTPSMLARDLISYSFLADDKNGAISFRSDIPVKYLNIVGVSASLREYFSIIKDNKAEDEEYLSNLVKSFTNQYFQHNPKKAKQFTEKEYEKYKEDRGSDIYPYVYIKGDGKDNGRLENREGQPLPIIDGEVFKQYDPTVFYVTPIKNIVNEQSQQDYFISGGKMFLKQIETVTNANTGVVSKVAKNVLMDRYSNALSKLTSVSELLSLLNKGTLSTEHKVIMNELTPHLGDVKLKIVDYIDENGNLAYYSHTSNTIVIHKNMYSILLRDYKDFNVVTKMVREIVFEEVIHSLTVNKLKEFIVVDKNNNIIGYKMSESLMPNFAKMIIKMYELAKKAVPYNEKNHYETYYSQDIFEFIAGMYVAPDYRELLEDKNSGFLNDFTRMICRLFQYLWKGDTDVKSADYKNTFYGAVKDLVEYGGYTAEPGKKSEEDVLTPFIASLAEPDMKEPTKKTEEVKPEPETNKQEPPDNTDINQDDINNLPPTKCN